MNERLKELMIQADYPAPEIALRAQILAKLIVAECLSICEDMGDNGKDGHYCADEIARTFLR